MENDNILDKLSNKFSALQRKSSAISLKGFFANRGLKQGKSDTGMEGIVSAILAKPEHKKLRGRYNLNNINCVFILL